MFFALQQSLAVFFFPVDSHYKIGTVFVRKNNSRFSGTFLQRTDEWGRMEKVQDQEIRMPEIQF